MWMWAQGPTSACTSHTGTGGAARSTPHTATATCCDHRLQCSCQQPPPTNSMTYQRSCSGRMDILTHLRQPVLIDMPVQKLPDRFHIGNTWQLSTHSSHDVAASRSNSVPCSSHNPDAVLQQTCSSHRYQMLIHLLVRL